MRGCMKRTTLVLEDGCIDRIRRIAQQERRQISEVVNELLADALQRRRRHEKPTMALPRFSMGRPRVNLGDRNALAGLMDS